MDFTFLKTYLSTTIAATYSIPEKRGVLAHWLSLYKSNSLSHDDGVNALRMIINPMLTWAMEQGQAEVLTPDLVHSLVTDVFKVS